MALVLARLHVRAHAGETSFCSISETVNCDKVATSRYSVVLGIPVAVWGAAGYALAAALAGWGLARKRPRTSFPAGLLFGVAAVAVAASIALAVVSKVLIGAWCLLCMASWALSAALLVAALRACRPQGAAAALRADLALARARPGRTAGAIAAGIALVTVVGLAYPAYWARAKAAPARAPADGGAQLSGPVTVVEYSDYECPFCARAHEDLRTLRSTHPELTVVRRHFPLDPACNPALKKVVHPMACGLARAGICAEAQGKFDAMDDALFRNQKADVPVPVLAERIGLDIPSFRDCLDAPQTTRRLAADVQAGIAAGVRATPTYVVNGVASAGEIPADVLKRLGPGRAVPPPALAR